MTNEEMAARIQQGGTGLCVELWEQVKKLVYLLAWQYYTRSQETCRRAGVLLEDLHQAAYLSMLDAVRGYKPEEEYKFTTYLTRHLHNRWAYMLGIKYGRENFDPLNRCTRLETPVNSEEGSSPLGNFVPDQAAAQAMEDTIEREDTAQLRKALQRCLDALGEDEAFTIRARFYEGQTFKAIAARQGWTIDKARRQEYSGLRKLREMENVRRLKAWIV